jgi:hypothetical protein
MPTLSTIHHDDEEEDGRKIWAIVREYFKWDGSSMAGRRRTPGRRCCSAVHGLKAAGKL